MSLENIEKELEEEFCEVGIDIEGNLVILERLQSMCTSYNLSASDMLARWFTYVATKNDCDFTVDVLDDFCKGSGKRSHTTPEEATNKRIVSLVRKSNVPFSPGSFSPNTGVAASPKYEGRQNKGQIVASCYFSGDNVSKWQGTRKGVEIKPYCEEANLKTPYKYMFEKLSDRSYVLDGIIKSLGDSMSTAFGLDEFKRITHSLQEEITCVGRICCDSMGKLNAKSMLIEGTKRISNGERVNFDVSEVRSFSSFPGQVVCAKGIRSTNRFVVKEIHDGVRLPFRSTLNKDQPINKADFTVYVACGPFATSDTLSHSPLGDFLNIIETERPDVCIMLGPFIDSRMPAIEKAEVDFAFDEKFKEYRDLITSSAMSVGSKVVFVPSQRDAHHHYVYPQPPFECGPNYFKENVNFVSDPATLSFNDVVFGITSTDILFHLGSEEAFSFSAGSSDRLGRICDHLLKQQSYYPLQPPSEEVNIDYLHFEEHALIDLRFFIKNVNGCLCINPGRLVKGQTGGTFAKLYIKPHKVTNEDSSIAISESSAEIVKV
eukprot:gene3065-1350_t